jgi:hypothetical protein
MTLADMTNAVDTLLNPAQLPPCNSGLNGAPAHSKRQKLPSTDDAVLSLGEIAYATIQRRRGTFSISDMGNVPLVWYRDDLGRSRHMCGAPEDAKDARKGGSSPPVPPLALIP